MSSDDFSEKNNVFLGGREVHETSVPVTRLIVRELKAEQRRTGLTGYALLRKLDNIPNGLTGDGINKWFMIFDGPVQRAPPEHINFVIAEYKKQPNVKKRWRKEKRVPITDDFLADLDKELARTGVVSKRIFTSNFDCPEGLNYPIFVSWRNRTTKQAFPSYMNAVMNHLKSLPDKDK
jgi:hypothetical protein